MSQRYATVAYYPSENVRPGDNVFIAVPFLRDFKLSEPQIIYRPPDDLTPLVDDIVQRNRSCMSRGVLPTITLATEVTPPSSRLQRTVSPGNSFDGYLRAPEREGLDAIAEELQRGRHATADEDYWSEEYWRALHGEDDRVSEASSSHTVLQKTPIWLDLSYPSDGSSPKKPILYDSFSPTLRKAGRRTALRHRGRVPDGKRLRSERIGGPNVRPLSEHNRREGTESVASLVRNSKIGVRYDMAAGSQREQEVRAGQPPHLLKPGDTNNQQQRMQLCRERFPQREAATGGEGRRLSHSRGKIMRVAASPVSKRCTGVYNSQVESGARIGSHVGAKRQIASSMGDKKQAVVLRIQSPAGVGGGRKTLDGNKPVKGAAGTDVTRKADPALSAPRAAADQVAASLGGGGGGHQTLRNPGRFNGNPSELNVLAPLQAVDSVPHGQDTLCCFSEPFQPAGEGPDAPVIAVREAMNTRDCATRGGSANEQSQGGKCGPSKCCSVM